MTVDVSEERVAVVQPADNYNNSKTQLSSGFGLQEMADRTSSSHLKICWMADVANMLFHRQCGGNVDPNIFKMALEREFTLEMT